MRGGYETVYRQEYSLSKDCELSVPYEVRERHFYEDEEPDEAEVQAQGERLSITIWSSRDNIRIALPLTEWCTEKAVSRSLSGMRVNLFRWSEILDARPTDSGAVIEGYVAVLRNDWRPSEYVPNEESRNRQEVRENR